MLDRAEDGLSKSLCGVRLDIKPNIENAAQFAGFAHLQLDLNPASPFDRVGGLGVHAFQLQHASGRWFVVGNTPGALT